MSPFSLDAAIPLALIGQDVDFFQFIEINRNLLFGYLSQCPIEERRVMKQAYIDSKHEKEWNEKHAKRLQEVQAQFEETVGAALAKSNPKLYRDRKYRTVLEEEVRLVQLELQSEYESKIDWGVVKLKEDNNTFSERWPQVLFNRFKVSQEEIEEKKKELAEADDFVLLWENVCAGAGCGNTVLGLFSMDVASAVAKVAKEILEKTSIPIDKPGQLSRYRASLEAIPASSRNIVLMHYFTDLLSYLQGCRGGSLSKTVSLLTANAAPEVSKVAVETEALHRSSFPSFEERYIKLIENPKIPAEIENKNHAKDTLSTINDYVVAQCYHECTLVRNSLADFLAIVQTSLDLDFTKNEIIQAKKGIGQLTKKMANMNLNVLKMSRSPLPMRPRIVSRVGRAQTVGSFGDAMSTLSSASDGDTAVLLPQSTITANTVPRSKNEQTRKDAKNKSSKLTDYHPEIDRAEEYRRIEGYVKVFTHTFRVFNKIIEEGERLRAKEKKK